MEKLLKIKAIITDVDGVLTDGGIIYDQQGAEIKKFNVKDGFIVAELQKLGFVIGMISGRSSAVLLKRATDLKLDFYVLGTANKVIPYQNFKDKFRLSDDQIAYIGDDLNDLGVIGKSGFSVCPADAPEYIKNKVHFVTKSKGGKGVFREIADMILEKQGLMTQIIEKYSQE
ncbi:MAG: 3-deoxy-manno-octulosonate-8-phosphatase [Bacteroidetes bacterium]|nr:MAG: 3-deoxy-manno-octulosonate-8-phosphatase [Bacteroidota bacterium]